MSDAGATTASPVPKIVADKTAGEVGSKNRLTVSMTFRPETLDALDGAADVENNSRSRMAELLILEALAARARAARG